MSLLTEDFKEDPVEQEKALQSHYPSMVDVPYRRGSGPGGVDEYIDTPASAVSKLLKEKGIRLVDLSREDIAEIRVGAMVEAAQAAGRSAEDIESMTKYLKAGIENADEEAMRRSLAISLSVDLEQQTNDLNLRKEVQAESDRVDHDVYPNSSFKTTAEDIELDRLRSTVAHQ